MSNATLLVVTFPCKKFNTENTTEYMHRLSIEKEQYYQYQNDILGLVLKFFCTVYC